MDEHHSWYNGSVWHIHWPYQVYVGQWPIFYGPAILLHILKTIWWRNIVLGIMDQCDSKIDLVKYTWISDLYSMVHLFYHISLSDKLFLYIKKWQRPGVFVPLLALALVVYTFIGTHFFHISWYIYGVGMRKPSCTPVPSSCLRYLPGSKTFHCFVLKSHFIQPSKCQYVLFVCLSVWQAAGIFYSFTFHITWPEIFHQHSWSNEGMLSHATNSMIFAEINRNYFLRTLPTAKIKILVK